MCIVCQRFFVMIGDSFLQRLPRQLLWGLLLGYLWCRHVLANEGEDYNLDYLEEFSYEELQVREFLQSF